LAIRIETEIVRGAQARPQGGAKARRARAACASLSGAARNARPLLARTSGCPWSAAQYVKFEQERTRPARDLVARIPLAHVENAADIGCGPGNSTEVLRERYAEARIVGVDSSPDMIAAARKRLPDIAFEVADISEWRPKSGST
jgi:SAM-dependent methyltransferase